MYLILALLLILAVIIFAPIFTIWSVNHLFNAGWEVDLATWAAVVWICLIIGGWLSQTRKKD